jgi:hypothetical protein
LRAGGRVSPEDLYDMGFCYIGNVVYAQFFICRMEEVEKRRMRKMRRRSYLF